MEKVHRCPVGHAGFLDNGLRKICHNPHKILKPHIHKGMKVADIGCGPGFFTLPMAELVGDTGMVYAYDLQKGMLDKVAAKTLNTPFETTISLHLCAKEQINFIAVVDCVLGFFMVHEVVDIEGLMEEIYMALIPDGIFLMFEPLIHVSSKKFQETCKLGEKAGFSIRKGPKVFFGRSVVMQKK